MHKSIVKLIAGSYLFTLGALSLWFMAEIAVANPLCTHCSVTLVKWALPRAEFLMICWVVAGIGAFWLYRHSLVNLLVAVLRHLQPPRKAVASPDDQGDE